MSYRFSKDFLFGAGICDYQHFGGASCDLPKIDAARHYWLYERDFELLKSMGLNALRTSIEWARIENKEGEMNQSAIEWYSKYLGSLRDHGLTSVVTLHHFTNPAWIHEYGGWLSDHVVQKFLEYVELVVDRVGDLIDYFIVINEPMMYGLLAYMLGDRGLPPRHNNLNEGQKAAERMLAAVSEAYDLIHKRKSGAMVSIAHAFNPMSALNWWNPYQQFVVYWANGKLLYEPIEKLSGKFDFLGMNYYCKMLTDGTLRARPIVYHRGLRDAMDFFYHNYGKPIMITENGFPNRDDRQKSAYLVQSLKTIQDSISEDGVKVLGYFWWSFLHGWEWRGLEYKPFFALVDVDIARTYARYVTKTAELYGRIAHDKEMNRSLYSAHSQILGKITFENWPMV